MERRTGRGGGHKEGNNGKGKGKRGMRRAETKM
jgi:hypothetical protein